MKTLIYKFYFYYYKKFPIQIGKTFLGNLLSSLLGNAKFRIKNCWFLLDTRSLIDRYLLIEGDYEKEIFNKASLALSNGGIFLDIGANFGLFTVQLGKISGVKVISFEPSPRELKRLFHHLAINNLNNVIVIPNCLGNENNIVKLNLSDSSNPGQNTILPLFNTPNVVEVDCYRLDYLISQSIWKQVKFIKIDVEGYEYEVLLGMGEFLNEYHGQIAIEITYNFKNAENGFYNADKIYDLLEQKGFVYEYGKKYADQYNEYFYKQHS